MCHSGPDPPSQTENQCVFIRGYRIMRRNQALGLLRRVKATDLQDSNTEYYSLKKPTDSRAARSPSLSRGAPPVRGRRASGGHGDFDLAEIPEDPDVDGDYTVEKLSGADEVDDTHIYVFL
jgi:hypothetical protein